MRIWPCSVAQEIVKEESAGRLDKAFGSRDLGDSGLTDLKTGATRDRSKGTVWKRSGMGEDRFWVVTSHPSPA